MKGLSKYFVRGLVYLAPISLTIYIAFSLITWLNGLLHIGIPGVGLLIALVLITILGYLGSMLISSPMVATLERWFIKIPLLSIIYTSIKDLVNAFAGGSNKFNKPVLVRFDKNVDAMKPGFLTATDLSSINLKESVAVYMPHSYNFSGNIFIVPKENVIPVDVPSMDFMKFIVSGGITHFNEKTNIVSKDSI